MKWGLALMLQDATNNKEQAMGYLKEAEVLFKAQGYDEECCAGCSTLQCGFLLGNAGKVRLRFSLGRTPTQETGFFTKRRVATPRFGKKHGFWDSTKLSYNGVDTDDKSNSKYTRNSRV